MHLSLLEQLILALAGFSAGFVDSIAGGGGIISLPALLAVGMPPHLAFGTNKLQASMGTAFAAGNYARRGLLDPSRLPLAMTCTALGALAGAMLVVRLPSMWLARVVPWLLVGIFVYVVRLPRLGESKREARMAAGTFAVVFGSSLGFYDGFFGPGTGSFWTMALLAVGGMALPQGDRPHQGDEPDEQRRGPRVVRDRWRRPLAHRARGRGGQRHRGTRGLRSPSKKGPV